MVYSNQEPNKSYALHLLDISLKALLIYRFPLSFPTPFISLQFICWGNQVTCLVVFHSLDFADCASMVLTNVFSCP